MNVERLVAQLEECDRAYARGRSLVSNSAYDRARDRLAQASPHHPYLGVVGDAPTDARRREPLPFIAGSLDKLRPGQVAAWMAQIERDVGQQRGWLVLPKFDGQSVILHYTNGVLDRGWSRGRVHEGRSVGVRITPALLRVQGVMRHLRPNDVYNLQQGEVCVRGEVVMHTSIWNRHYQPELDRLRAVLATPGRHPEEERLLQQAYKNPRNMCSGILGALDDRANAVHLGRCTMIGLQLWRRVGGAWVRPPSAHAEWVLLTLMGFTPSTMPTRWSQAHHRIVQKVREGHHQLRSMLPIHDMGGIGQLAYWDHHPTEQEVSERLSAIRKVVDIRLDGLVVMPENMSRAVGQGRHLQARPDFMRSIKLDVQDQDRLEGHVGRIEWRTRKRGVVMPRLVLRQSLHFDGVDVDHCTLNNARNVCRWGLRPGRPIRMIRSGDVIPHLVGVYDRGAWRSTKVQDDGGRWRDAPGITDPRVLATLPTHCPECNTQLRWTRTRGEEEPTHLYCENQACPGRTGTSVLSFFRLLGVDDVGQGVVEHLMRAGMTTVVQILSGATPSRLAQLEGYGPRRAEIVSRAVSGSLFDKPLARIMHATNLFSDERSSLGSTRLADIVGHIGEGMLERATPMALRQRLADLHGLGPSGLELFLAGLPRWRRTWTELRPYYGTSRKGAGGLKGQVVTFTGFRHHEMQGFIEVQGGRVAGMSRKTTLLIAAGRSRKTDRADELGTKVVSQQEAWDWLRRNAK